MHAAAMVKVRRRMAIKVPMSEAMLVDLFDDLIALLFELALEDQ